MTTAKEIITTYHQLRQAVPALDALMQQPLKAVNALQISRLAKLINAEMETFTEQHRALIVKHGGEPDDKGFLRVPQTAVPAFNIEYEEMVNSDIALGVRPLTIKALDDVSITPVDMLALEFLLED